MALQNYGVLKGRPFEYQRGTPQNEHFQVLINRGNDPHRIAINTKSSTTPSQLLYFANEDYKHEITGLIPGYGLQNGFTALPSQAGGLALDFIRRNLLDTSQMVPLPPQGPAANDDLNDRFEFFISQAIADPSAIVYAFGVHWVDSNKADKYFPEINPSKGIHDIHFNQGNPKGSYYKDNGTWQDGAILIHFPSRNRWVGVFTAFQSQSFNTDENGNPSSQGDDVIEPTSQFPVSITAALVNPSGNDAGLEFVLLLNKSNTPISLNGWKILDKMDRADTISNSTIDAWSTLRIGLSGNGALLGNNGGIITLLNSSGLKIDGVSYTQNNAAIQGELVVF